MRRLSTCGAAPRQTEKKGQQGLDVALTDGVDEIVTVDDATKTTRPALAQACRACAKAKACAQPPLFVDALPRAIGLARRREVR